jgi:PAS domain S-box-containing protein
MSSSRAISYDDVLNRLREAEDVIQALLLDHADAIVTPGGVHMLRLHETDQALHQAKASLEKLLKDRTSELVRANQELWQEIKERKAAETALAASETKFRALVESAPEAVIAVDEFGFIALVNAATEQMFGYSRNDLIGRPMESLVPQGLVEIGAAQGDRRTPVPVPGQEFTARREDGSEFPIELRVSLVDAGDQRMALALVTDISERKTVEARLRETQKLESIGLLAGGVAHDFNNLLTAILGNASLLLDDVPEHAIGRLRAVISGAEKAAQVTRQLLAYAGKGQFLISDIDLSALVRENAELIRISAPKRIEIRLDLKDGLPRIHADAGQIQQVLMNLVINACEAIADGDNGAISISCGAESSAGARWVYVTVTDTGCGMSEQTKARIFDPFYTTKVYGRGLGLSAVLGILRSCAATIEIETAPGKGTTFSVLFPAVEAEPKVEAATAPPADSRAGATVLVVEDEDFVRAFTVAALKRAGYSVLQAVHGEEAVAAVREKGRIDLVLLDVTMPVMGGREAFEKIRELRPNLPVMVTSGYGSDETARLMDLVGKEASFIQKPYRAQQLLDSIEAAIARR